MPDRWHVQWMSAAVHRTGMSSHTLCSGGSKDANGDQSVHPYNAVLILAVRFQFSFSRGLLSNISFSLSHILVT